LQIVAAIRLVSIIAAVQLEALCIIAVVPVAVTPVIAGCIIAAIPVWAT
jgi:hypothetical protein